jgi:hypothetical protein
MTVEPETVVVTTAGLSATQEREQRMRRYLYTQLVRAVCFVLAVALPVPLWAKLLLIVGAFTLPWMGVVNANGGPRRGRQIRPDSLDDRVEPVRIQIEAGRVVDQD